MQSFGFADTRLSKHEEQNGREKENKQRRHCSHSRTGCMRLISPKLMGVHHFHRGRYLGPASAIWWDWKEINIRGNTPREPRNNHDQASGPSNAAIRNNGARPWGRSIFSCKDNKHEVPPRRPPAIGPPKGVTFNRCHAISTASTNSDTSEAIRVRGRPDTSRHENIVEAREFRDSCSTTTDTSTFRTRSLDTTRRKSCHRWQPHQRRNDLCG